MKKIIESELISIAHRILKLKDKADINALYNESKNVFEKISVLKFYEDNKFRIDASITDEIIGNALFPENNETAFVENTENNQLDKIDVFPSQTESRSVNASMEMDLVNELIEESKNTDVVSFEDAIEEDIEEEILVTERFIEDIDENINESFDNENIVFSEEVEKSAEIENVVLKEDLNLEPKFNTNVVNSTNIENGVEENFEEEVFVNETTENDIINTVVNESNVVLNEVSDHNSEIQILEIDPIFNLSLEEINFEQKHHDNNYNSFTEDVIPVAEKHVNIENQHLMNSSESNEVPFHQIPLNKTINDAFSKMITIGLNDRIAFEKNLFDGNSEDLNRVLSQLNTIESFQDAQDFIEDLVKPDFNYWKDKEEYETRFMDLIQKRFL